MFVPKISKIGCQRYHENKKGDILKTHCSVQIIPKLLSKL